MNTKHSHGIKWRAIPSVLIIILGLSHFAVYYIGYASSGKQWSGDVASLALAILPAPAVAALILLFVKTQSFYGALIAGAFILTIAGIVASTISALIEIDAGYVSYAIGAFILFALPTISAYCVLLTIILLVSLVKRLFTKQAEVGA